ncbi:MAG: hypothetical protein IJ968_00795 [Clostridia bacterium]|nr:hypothetical protein [Clostridia bacterium]
MTTSKVRRIIAFALTAIALIAVVCGIVTLILRNGKTGEDALQSMRLYSVINASGDVETFVAIAEKQATEAAKQEYNEKYKSLPRNDPNRISMAELTKMRKAEAAEATRRRPKIWLFCISFSQSS